MNTEALNLNERAETHLKNGEWNAALALFQKVFLDFSRAADPPLRVQVARALWGAAQCSRAIGDTKRAEQIQTTLERRYGGDSHSRVRYYVELSRGNAPTASLDKTEQNPAPDNWDDFLSANGLDDEETAPTPISAPAPFTAQEDVLPSSFIPEGEVSVPRLKALFDAAFVENALEGPELLRIVPDGATRVLVAVNEANKLVHFVAIYGLKKFASESDKLKLANRLNDEIIFVRFAVSNETQLIGDYYLPYAGGLMLQQVIHAARLLARITSNSISKADEDECLA